VTRFVGTPLRGIEFSSVSDEAISARVNGDGHPRIRIDAGGRITWSGGSTSGDTTLYRDAADLLTTDDVFKATGGLVTLATDGAPTAALPDGALAIDTTNNLFYFRSDSTWNQVSGGGGASVTVSDTAPVEPNIGDLWFNSSTALTYVYYDSVWVQIGGSPSGVAGSTYTETIGDGTNDTFVITHNLGTRDVFVTIRNSGSPYEVIDAYWAATTSNTITVDFSVVPTTGSVRVAVYAAVTGDNFALAVEDLTNTDITSPTAGQVLKYDGTNWTNDTDDAGTTIESIDDIADVTITDVTSGDFLQWNGTAWVNQNDGLVPAGGLEGQIIAKVTDTDHDLQWIDNYTGDLRIIAKNDSGVTVSKGQVVMAVGAVGDRIQIAKAVADGSVSAKYMLGLASQDILDSEEGYVQMLGEIRNLNTIAYAVGTVLYINPASAGGLTSTEPTSPNLAEAVAIVTRSHASTGILFVRMWSQGESVSELHDVAIDTLTSGDFLKWNGTVWVNDPTLPTSSLSTSSSNDNSASMLVTGLTVDEYGRVTNITSATHRKASETETGIIFFDGQYFEYSDGPFSLTGTARILADLTPAVDKLPYFDSTFSAATTNLTSAARTLLDDTSTSAMRTTLGVGTTDNPAFAGATIDGVRVGITAANEIDTVSGNLTIDSAGGTVTIDDNLIVSGDFTVNGTTTTLNTETLAIEDNIIVLNSGVTGSPTLDAGIEVERGTQGNAKLYWSEDFDTSGTGQWRVSIPIDGGGTDTGILLAEVSSLNALADVVYEAPSENNVLAWVDGAWTAVPAPVGGAVVSDTPPESPEEGALWFESDSGKTFVYTDSSWVEVGGGIKGDTGDTGPAGPAGPTGPSFESTFAYKVGDTGPGGGIIFFVDRYNEYPDFTYLEVAPIGSHVERSWSSGFFDYDTEIGTFVVVPNAYRRGLGGGFQNTAEIVAVAMSDSTSENAAKYCDSLTLGGQSDWYLPSISELKLAFETLYFEFFSSTAMNEYLPVLWSSTQIRDQSAWIIFGSSNAARTTQDKSELSYVAPVRRF
jgi:hypothetical protein